METTWVDLTKPGKSFKNQFSLAGGRRENQILSNNKKGSTHHHWLWGWKRLCARTGQQLLGAGSDLQLTASKEMQASDL